jgi:hypothetical protein
MLKPDYSARDKAVKHNVYASVRKRDGLSHKRFAGYWRDVHATLCSRLPGLGFYVQQHFDREGGANLWPRAIGVDRVDALLDGSAELGFANAEDQAAFSEDGTRNGPDLLHRIHVYMSRRPGDDTTQWLMDSSAELASLDAIQKWKLHLPVPYENAHPAPPSPDVDHVVGPDRLHVAVVEVAFENARIARSFFASAPFKKHLAAQSKHIHAIAAYAVSGFYTFVRDGKVTPAGIRGSRPAELIDELGAMNQLDTTVRGKFVCA